MKLSNQGGENCCLLVWPVLPPAPEERCCAGSYRQLAVPGLANIKLQQNMSACYHCENSVSKHMHNNGICWLQGEFLSDCHCTFTASSVPLCPLALGLAGSRTCRELQSSGAFTSPSLLAPGRADCLCELGCWVLQPAGGQKQVGGGQLRSPMELIFSFLFLGQKPPACELCHLSYIAINTIFKTLKSSSQRSSIG